MKARLWVGAFAVVSGAAAIASGCGLVAGLDDFKDAPVGQGGNGGTGGDGGSSSSSSSSGAGGAGGSPIVCGNGMVEAGEECDGGNLENATCSNCKLVCSAGWLNCDNDATTGCESDPLIDGENCGACGHSCLGGTCTNGLCDVTVLSPVEIYAADIAVTADALYWVNNDATNGQIRKYNLSTAQVTTLAEGLEKPSYLAVDDSHVYVTCSGVNGTLKRVPLAGGMPETLHSLTNYQARYVILDDTYVYWVAWSSAAGAGSVLSRLTKADKAIVPLTLPNAELINTTMALDDTHIYVGTAGWKFFRAPKDLSSIDQLGMTTGQARGMARYGSWLYWGTDYSGVWKAQAVGGGSVSLVPNTNQGNSSVDIVVADGLVYAFIAANDEIVSVPVTGGTPKTIVKTPIGARGNLAIDSKYLYWSDYVYGTINRVPR